MAWFPRRGSAPQPPWRQPGWGPSLPPSKDGQSLLTQHRASQRFTCRLTGPGFRYSQEPTSVQPLLSTPNRLVHYCASLTWSPTLPSPRCHPVRGGFSASHVSVGTSLAAVLHVMPSLRLPCFQVSVPRDSKAGDLPGMTLHHTTDYQPKAGNGFGRFLRMAPV